MTAEALDAVLVWLGDDSDLVALIGDADRVFGGELPRTQAQAMPRACVVVSEAGGFQGAGDLPLDTQRIDCRSYGATPRQAKAVALAVHARLRSLTREQIGNTLIHSATPSGGYIGLREPGVDWPLVLRSYAVLYDEREVA